MQNSVQIRKEKSNNISICIVMSWVRHEIDDAIRL